MRKQLHTSKYGIDVDRSGTYIQIKYPPEFINNVRVEFENLLEFNEIYGVCLVDSEVLIKVGSIIMYLPLKDCTEKYNNATAPITLTITGSGPPNNPLEINWITQYTN